MEVVRAISQQRMYERIVLKDTPPTRDKPAYEPQFDLAESAVGIIISSQTESERELTATQTAYERQVTNQKDFAHQSQLQFLDKVVDMLVVVQRQISVVQKIHKTMEVPQVQVVEKTVKIPQLHIVEQIVEVPEIQMVQGTCPSGGTSGNWEVLEIGAPLPAESASPIFVTAPVLEAPPAVVE